MEVPNGFLLIDKPSGWTSFDVVNKVRSIIAGKLQVKPRTIKVGHSGTLDPQATGLLVLAIGGATKRISELTKLDKVYQVEATFGMSSDTGDSEGKIIKAISASRPDATIVKQVLMSFVGDILQSPHRYSAIKVNGVRAYKRARRGEDVKIEPREVTIYKIEDIKYDWPMLSFTTEVSSGTYIRSLVEDIAKKLNTKALMSRLRRTKIANYTVESASAIDGLTYEKILNSIITP